LAQNGRSPAAQVVEHVAVFQYPANPDGPGAEVWPNWQQEEESAGQDGDRAGSQQAEAAAAAERAAWEARIVEEARKAFEAGRERGRQEGQKAEREASGARMAAAAQEHVRKTMDLIENFAREREHFSEAAEPEVVELALAVAARILRREAQMDPLLLTGAVRVALGQLSASTEVRLLVPAADLPLWTAAVGLIPKLAVRPIVLAGEDMRLGDCRIETEMGSVDLGVRSQLGEIEHGFFDRAGGERARTVSSDSSSEQADRESGP